MTGEDLIIAVSVIASGLIMAGAAVASALGISQVAAKFLEGAARNPLETPKLQAKAFIMIGTLEGVPMIAIGVAMLLLFANPYVP